MESKASKVMYWTIAVVLLSVSGWFFNIAFYNWWSAGFFATNLNMRTPHEGTFSSSWPLDS